MVGSIFIYIQRYIYFYIKKTHGHADVRQRPPAGARGT